MVRWVIVREESLVKTADQRCIGLRPQDLKKPDLRLGTIERLVVSIVIGVL